MLYIGVDQNNALHSFAHADGSYHLSTSHSKKYDFILQEILCTIQQTDVTHL